MSHCERHDYCRKDGSCADCELERLEADNARLLEALRALQSASIQHCANLVRLVLPAKWGPCIKKTTP